MRPLHNINRPTCHPTGFFPERQLYGHGRTELFHSLVLELRRAFHTWPSRAHSH